MELSISTPALLFPAISLLMLAYTNRFLALASLIRGLKDKYSAGPEQNLVDQIKNLRTRIKLIKSMQAFGVISFIFCVICMYCIFRGWAVASYWIFALSILAFTISLVLSFIEIALSTKALDLVLSDIENLEEENIFRKLLK
ncbi:DUF2721 domain-containing protein [Gynurincola endophyticus]|jgi:hypothetical protein|uniref:DUF2721 domain-containing protein n=1 Tax=Gynurincola endophyticus TaxID=2479004 RepID=UPI000F8F5CFB|nr:DUF2721 domain-containing protein [Gynurincola endophyticus]